MTNELMNLDNIPSSVSNNAPTNLPFTPRLQILHSLGKVIKDWQGSKEDKPAEGDFWFGPPGGVNLKRQFLGIPLAVRDHALATEGSNVELESYHCAQKGCPPNSQAERDFAEIMGRPKQSKDPKGKTVFNYYGGDVLFWLPLQENFPRSEFAIYFLHSTARPVVERCREAKGTLMLITSGVGKSASFRWPIPEPHAAPPVDPTDPNYACLRDPAFVQSVTIEVTKFLNPVTKDEKAEGIDGRPR